VLAARADRTPSTRRCRIGSGLLTRKDTRAPCMRHSIQGIPSTSRHTVPCGAAEANAPRYLDAKGHASAPCRLSARIGHVARGLSDSICPPLHDDRRRSAIAAIERGFAPRSPSERPAHRLYDPGRSGQMAIKFIGRFTQAYSYTRRSGRPFKRTVLEGAIQGNDGTLDARGRWIGLGGPLGSGGLGGSTPCVSPMPASGTRTIPARAGPQRLQAA